MPRHCEPWPGKRKTGLRLGAGDALGEAAVHPRPRRARRGAPSSSSRSAPSDDGAVLEGGAGGRQRVGDVGEVELGVRRCRWAARRAACLAQGGLGLGRERQRDRGRRSGRRRAPGSRPVALGVASARRGASSRITWALVPLMPKEETPARRGRAVRLPGLGLGQQLDLARLPVDLRGGRVDVQGLRQHAVAHRHHHLDHAGDPRRGLGVADVGLDRAEPQRPLSRPGRRWRAGRRPRSGRRGWCRCRGPRPRRRPAASRPALASAWRITRSCEGPLGAVRPLEAPSWLTAEPRIDGEDPVAVALRRRRGARARARRRPRPSRRRRPPRRRTCSGRRGRGRAGG